MPSRSVTQQLITKAVVKTLALIAGAASQVLYVHKTDATLYPHAAAYTDSGAGLTVNNPITTLDGAIRRCVANRGDRIIVLPGHTEDVSAAAGINADIAGITIEGVGEGSLKPKINFTATAATMTITAASITISNILFTGGIDAVASLVVVSAADCTLRDIEYRDVTGQCTVFILTTAGASRLMIERLVYRGDSAAGTGAAIAIVGGDGIMIKDFSIVGNFSVAAIDIRTTATTNLQVFGCNSGSSYIWTKNAADLAIRDTVTGSTGRIGPNISVMLTDNAANITEAFTGATFHYFQPLQINNLAGESSIPTNITAATDA